MIWPSRYSDKSQTRKGASWMPKRIWSTGGRGNKQSDWRSASMATTTTLITTATWPTLASLPAENGAAWSLIFGSNPKLPQLKADLEKCVKTLCGCWALGVGGGVQACPKKKNICRYFFLEQLFFCCAFLRGSALSQRVSVFDTYPTPLITSVNTPPSRGGSLERGQLNESPLLLIHKFWSQNCALCAGDQAI